MLDGRQVLHGAHAAERFLHVADQQRVDRLSDEADKLLREYRQVTKVVDGLEVYNGLLQKQVDAQVAEMDQLRDSIGQVALIERQIVPLMVRMIDALDAFIALDVPFLATERQERVARLRAMHLLDHD